MPLFDITPEEYSFLLTVRENKKEYERLKSKGEMLDDGLGSECSIWCDDCKKPTMYVCRPGDFRCSNCENMEYRARLIEEARREGKKGNFVYNGKQCPECKGDLFDDISKKYLTNPPKVLAICLECGYNNKRIC